MSLAKHKKAGTQMRFVIGFAILAFSFVLILGVWRGFFSEAEGATAEQLCRTFNAARTKGKVKIGEFTLFNVVPRTCRMLPKEIPSKDYENEYKEKSESAMLEISKSIARCWWQWLEGVEDDIFGTTKNPLAKKKCFTCYTFQINKGADSFQGAELTKFLDDNQHIVKDSSDMCNVNGGGTCIPKDTDCGENAKQIPSSRCKEEEICCNQKIECLNKGGSCEDNCPTGTKEYKGWLCSDNDKRCCVNDNDFLTYTDYVQDYMGEGTILIDVDEFKAMEETYAITFAAKTALWGDLRRQLSIPTSFLSDVTSAIIVSELNKVENECNIELDVSSGT
jgi:hypothetical protein